MPDVLLRIRDLSPTADPSGLSFPVDGASIGAGASERITAENLAAWVGTQLTLGGSPGGTDGAIQYKNAGSFAGSADLIWDEAGTRLSVFDELVIGHTTDASYGSLTVWGGNIAVVNNDVSFHTNTTTIPLQSSYINSTWSDPTVGSRKSRVKFVANDYGGPREYLRVDADGTTSYVSVGGATNTAHKLTVYGHVGPGANATSDLGSPSYLWNILYSKQWQVGDAVNYKTVFAYNSLQMQRKTSDAGLVDAVSIAFGLSPDSAGNYQGNYSIQPYNYIGITPGLTIYADDGSSTFASLNGPPNLNTGFTSFGGFYPGNVNTDTLGTTDNAFYAVYLRNSVCDDAGLPRLQFASSSGGTDSRSWIEMDDNGVILHPDSTIYYDRRAVVSSTADGILMQLDVGSGSQATISTSGGTLLLNYFNAATMYLQVSPTCTLSFIDPNYSSRSNLTLSTASISANRATVSISSIGASLMEFDSSDNVDYKWSGAIGSSVAGDGLTIGGRLRVRPVTPNSPTVFTAAGQAYPFVQISPAGTSVNKEWKWPTGTVSFQAAVQIDRALYSFVGASTITDAISVYINQPPAAGTNATITNAYALWVEGRTKIRAGSVSSGTPTLFELFNAFSSTTTFKIAESGDTTFSPMVRSTGSPTGITYTGAAHTTLTASTESTDVNLNFARTVQFATGALTTQRAMRIQAPTYAFVAASTLTTAVTVDISGAPIQGTNATITNQIALRVGTGVAAGVGVQINGATSQSGDAFQYKNSGGTTLTKIAADGTITAPSLVLSTTPLAIGSGGTGQTTKAAAFDALQPMTTLGDVIYGDASGTGTRLAGQTTANIKALTQTGTGSVSAAPTWTAIVTAVTAASGAVTVNTTTTTGAVAVDLNLANANTWTAAQTFQAGTSGSAPIIGKANASGTVPLFQLQKSDGTVYVEADVNGYFFPDDITFGVGVGTPVIVATNATNKVVATRAGKIVKAWAVATTGPTGADLICDINLNGTSIWASTQANRIKIVNGATTGNQTSFDTTTFSAGDTFSIDVDQVGSTIAGQDITIVLAVELRNR